MFMCAQQIPLGIVCCVLSGTKQLLQEGAGTSLRREGSAAGRQLPSPCTDAQTVLLWLSNIVPRVSIFSSQDKWRRFFQARRVFDHWTTQLKFFHATLFCHSLREPDRPQGHFCPWSQISRESGEKGHMQQLPFPYIHCWLQQTTGKGIPQLC